MHLAPTVHWSTLLNRKSKKLRTLMPKWPQVATVATKSFTIPSEISVK